MQQLSPFATVQDKVSQGVGEAGQEGHNPDDADMQNLINTKSSTPTKGDSTSSPEGGKSNQQVHQHNQQLQQHQIQQLKDQQQRQHQQLIFDRVQNDPRLLKSRSMNSAILRKEFIEAEKATEKKFRPRAITATPNINVSRNRSPTVMNTNTGESTWEQPKKAVKIRPSQNQVAPFTHNSFEELSDLEGSGNEFLMDVDVNASHDSAKAGKESPRRKKPKRARDGNLTGAQLVNNNTASQHSSTSSTSQRPFTGTRKQNRRNTTSASGANNSPNDNNSDVEDEEIKQKEPRTPCIFVSHNNIRELINIINSVEAHKNFFFIREDITSELVVYTKNFSTFESIKKLLSQKKIGYYTHTHTLRTNLKPSY